ncbi:hypothetical protein, partial [Pseudomonas aeruginosa]|uniref:hypothetical protein n=1 Tax=Pseudomonas aeruginosa TaxID=287 RepID=UPI001F4A7D41
MLKQYNVLIVWYVGTPHKKRKNNDRKRRNLTKKYTKRLRGGDVGKRLTDKERRKITADYIECGNYCQVARKYKI